VFGSSEPGGPIDQVHVAPDMNGDGQLVAFDLASGHQNWAVPKAGSTESDFLPVPGQPGPGLDGSVYVTEFGTGGAGWGLQAFDPADGSRTWRFDPDIASEASGPAIGSDGTIYLGWDLARVSAVSPAGDELWRALPSDGVRTAPSVAPDGTTLLVGGGGLGVPGSLQALATADGTELWRVDLPEEDNGVDLVPAAPARFTPDSARAYLAVSVLGDPPAFRSCYLYAVRTGAAQTFCDASDGALAACPCATGAPDTGCDVPIPAPQGGGTTGGVGLAVLSQEQFPDNRATLVGSGFPAGSSPSAVVIRSTSLVASGPVVFGDGLRCIGAPLVRLAATLASGGVSTHAFGHGPSAGAGTFYYQLWFRSTPLSYCDATSAFNLSSGVTLTW
jgi:hypothetical protein